MTFRMAGNSLCNCDCLCEKKCLHINDDFKSFGNYRQWNLNLEMYAKIGVHGLYPWPEHESTLCF